MIEVQRATAVVEPKPAEHQIRILPGDERPVASKTR